MARAVDSEVSMEEERIVSLKKVARPGAIGSLAPSVLLACTKLWLEAEHFEIHARLRFSLPRPALRGCHGPDPC